MGVGVRFTSTSTMPKVVDRLCASSTVHCKGLLLLFGEWFVMIGP